MSAFRLGFLLLAASNTFWISACSGSGAGCGRYGECDYDHAEREDSALASNVDAEDVEQPEFSNCTEDCSGHEAGFTWAQENDVVDSSECGGKSDSFIEGCESFAEERELQAQSDAEFAEEYEEANDDYDAGRW